MAEKGLSDSGRRTAELRYEWQSFLGLLPVLDLQPMDPVLYQRCLTAVWRSRKSAISRTDLQQAVGVAFQGETVAFDLLDARILNRRLPEKRVQQVRKERDELGQIYEATWLELENAIGSQSAEAIRKSVEDTREPGVGQLELPLESRREISTWKEKHDATSKRG